MDALFSRGLGGGWGWSDRIFPESFTGFEVESHSHEGIGFLVEGGEKDVISSDDGGCRAGAWEFGFPDEVCGFVENSREV